MPLRDALSILETAARRGDARAACRLAAELTTCQAARLQARFRMSPEALAGMLAQQRLDPKQIDQRVDSTLQMQQHLDRLLAHCEGVEPETLTPAARYFMLAADAGHAPSMIQALQLDHYAPAVLFRDPALIPQFRANARRYLDAALETGDPAVVELLRRATQAPDASPLASMLPEAWRSPGFATALQARLRAAQGVKPPVAAPGVWRLEALQPTAAEAAEADRVFARFFEGKVQPASAPAQRPVVWPNIERFRCDENAG